MLPPLAPPPQQILFKILLQTPIQLVAIRKYFLSRKRPHLWKGLKTKSKLTSSLFFAHGLICKESYKHIMRKCVEKVYEKSKLTHIKDEKISQLVESYVSKLS